jgi:hypothetical protein
MATMGFALGHFSTSRAFERRLKCERISNATRTCLSRAKVGDAALRACACGAAPPAAAGGARDSRRAAASGEAQRAVVVDVVAVGMLQAALDQLFEVIAMRHGFVAAAGAVLMARLMPATGMA